MGDRYRRSPIARLWRGTVLVPAPPGIPGRCLLRTTSIQAKGYATIGFRGRSVLAHRLAFETVRGPIPPDAELHHECGRPACWNPWHVEPLTEAEHTKLHHLGRCRKGHAIVGANVKIEGGVRRCAICRARNRRRRLDPQALIDGGAA